MGEEPDKQVPVGKSDFAKEWGLPNWRDPDGYPTRPDELHLSDSTPKAVGFPASLEIPRASC